MGESREEEMKIVQPRCDKREYKRIVLHNSLEVLLISDPHTDKHGGCTNAYTGSKDTNFHFEVNSDAFEEALDRSRQSLTFLFITFHSDVVQFLLGRLYIISIHFFALQKLTLMLLFRFAQFFISPLMSPDATMREIKAVDSGSWDTLEVRPRANGVDTREELLKFYKEYYSANLMQLVVYGKDSLDNTERLVESKFQHIPNTDRKPHSFPGQPCTSDQLQILVRAVPIKDGHKLRVAWPITPGIRYYREGPCKYVGHLIGHEAEGSLFYVLKTLGEFIACLAYSTN
ncbi:hypothetical protein KSS87_001154 [Heliosperma pusillum]|nr:hypothetical protein KSS87_001154 [Heliosperma pusillum]